MTSSLASTPTERATSTPDAWIAGNSHVIALVDGLAEPSRDPLGTPGPRFADGAKRWAVENTTLAFTRLVSGAVETEVFSEVFDGRVRLRDPKLRRTFRADSGTYHITPDRLWGFCNVNNNGRIFREPMWQEHAPSHLAHGRFAPLTDDVVRAIVERYHHGVRVFFEQLRQAGVDFFAVSAPAPRRDHPAARTEAGREITHYVDSFSRSVWREWLHERDIPLIEPPSETVADDGFLREDLHHVKTTRPPDVSHGNARYGKLVVAEIARHVGKRP